MTDEYAVEKLNEALKAGDTAEIEKWAFIIRSGNDWRARCRQKERQMDEVALRLKIRNSYKLS